MIFRGFLVNSLISSKELKKKGKCPLTPEEVALVLSALGFGPKTYIFLAGSNIYGGRSRMIPLTKLFPNMVTKEDLLTPSELAPFKNFSNQVLKLSYIYSHQLNYNEQHQTLPNIF